jgi:hypothetical protein
MQQKRCVRATLFCLSGANTVAFGWVAAKYPLAYTFRIIM